jgi:hypothetical protein
VRAACPCVFRWCGLRCDRRQVFHRGARRPSAGGRAQEEWGSRGSTERAFLAELLHGYQLPRPSHGRHGKRLIRRLHRVSYLLMGVRQDGAAAPVRSVATEECGLTAQRGCRGHRMPQVSTTGRLHRSSSHRLGRRLQTSPTRRATRGTHPAGVLASSPSLLDGWSTSSAGAVVNRKGVVRRRDTAL